MAMLEEAIVACPYCWEQIELSVDLSAGSQTYTEDCSVCCQPILVKLHVNEEGGDPDDPAFSVDVEAENE